MIRTQIDLYGEPTEAYFESKKTYPIWITATRSSHHIEEKDPWASETTEVTIQFRTIEEAERVARKILDGARQIRKQRAAVAKVEESAAAAIVDHSGECDADQT